MFWQLASFPKCEHHLFLSHCAEDRSDLVWPVFERLQAAGVRPWLDREDYQYGRPSRSALRDALGVSRHVAFFVTDHMLDSARGWCVLELGYTEIIQANLIGPGGPLANVYLPLYLVPQADERLPRSVWQTGRDLGAFYDGPPGEQRVGWCVDQLLAFLRREQLLATRLVRHLRQDTRLSSQLAATPGLLDRVTKFAPARLQGA